MDVRIKGETEEYRKLRNQLLEAEIALKDQTERVATLRRQLPKGPPVEIDYVFREGPFRPSRGFTNQVSRCPPLGAVCSRQGQPDRGSHDVGSEGRPTVPDVQHVGRWLRLHRAARQRQS